MVTIFAESKQRIVWGKPHHFNGPYDFYAILGYLFLNVENMFLLFR